MCIICLPNHVSSNLIEFIRSFLRINIISIRYKTGIPSMIIGSDIAATTGRMNIIGISKKWVIVSG